MSLRVPQRGDKRALAETVTRNAAEALTQHRLKRASDLTARSAALTELADTLGMDVAPLRIECIDISHVQGTDVVASLVVFEDGLPKRSDYRRFAIREHPGDDVASIAEVVRRRFTHGAKKDAAEAASNVVPEDSGGDDGTGGAAGTVVQENGIVADDEPTYRRGIDPDTGRPRRFAYPPQLLVVDGGAPQVNAAATELAELGIVDVTICGLAKRLEEVWVPAQDEPIIFPRTSEALYLLQRLRDEAHRFAITYHRAKRSKSMTVSALDNVAGSRRGPAQGAGPAFRVGGGAAQGGRRGHPRGSRGRPADSRGGGRGTRRAGRNRAPAAVGPVRPAGRGRSRCRQHAPAPVPIPSSGTQEPAVSGQRVRRRGTGEGPEHGQQRATAGSPGTVAPSTCHSHENGPKAGIQVAIVSGLSGAGRSTAAKCLEDMGWFVVDNLPPELITTMVDLGSGPAGTSPGSRSCWTSDPGRSPRTWPR